MSDQSLKYISESVDCQLCDPDVKNEEQDGCGMHCLSSNEKKYFCNSLHSPASIGAFVHMNSEDNSTIGKHMSEGNVMFLHSDRKFKPDIFPRRMFGYVMCAKIKNTNRTKEEMRAMLSKLEALIDNSSTGDTRMDVKKIMGCGLTKEQKASCTGDYYKWDCSVSESPSNWSGIRYSKNEDGTIEFWLVTHGSCDGISQEFHRWIKNIIANNKDEVSLSHLYKSPIYKKLSGLARRYCCRLMYKTAKALGVDIATQKDVLAYKGDKREETPLMAKPDIINQYNYLKEIKVEDNPVVILMNKTTNVNDSEGLVLMTSPMQPVHMFSWNKNHVPNKYKKTIHDNIAHGTVPVSLGKSKHYTYEYSIGAGKENRELTRSERKKKLKQREAMAIKVKKNYYWPGRGKENKEVPDYLLDDSYRSMSDSKMKMLMEDMGLPPSKKLYPLVLVVAK